MNHRFFLHDLAEVAALRAQLHSQVEQRQFISDLVENMPHTQIVAELEQFKTEVAAALTTLEQSFRPDLFRTAEFHQAAMKIVEITREQLGLAQRNVETCFQKDLDAYKCTTTQN